MNTGDTAEASFTVQAADTARALSISPEDQFPEVFATSRMIALMELAAARLMKSDLKDGELSVGVSLNVRHTAPTPVRLLSAVSVWPLQLLSRPSQVSACGVWVGTQTTLPD